MRPEKLIINAFGAFNKKQTIEFKEFNKSPIFLITGPTGSGKSTIFDSICFALYGENSSDSKNTKTLKSDYSNMNEKCYVEFTFSVHDELFTVKRFPQQQKKCRNGDISYTSEKVSICFKGTEIVGKKEVDQKIVEVIGLSKKQFKKIVMLPQGDFKKLLESKSDEKQEIFRKIFSTEIFERFSKELVNKSKENQNKIIDLEKENQTHIKSINTFDNNELRQIIDSKSNLYQNIIDIIESETNVDKNKLKKYEIAINDLIKQKQDINLASIVEINNTFDQLEKIELEVQQLENQTEMFTKKTKELEYYEGIKEIISILSTLKKYKNDCIGLEDNLKKSELILEENTKILKELDSKGTIIEQKKLEIEKINQNIELNKTLIPTLQHRENIKRQKEHMSLSLSENIQKKENNILLQERLKCTEQLNMLNEITNQMIELKNNVIIKEENNIKYSMASKKYNDSLDKYIKGISFSLAENLRPGLPCPVCGSCTHPNPTEKTNEKMTESQLNEIRSEYEKLIIENENINQKCSAVLKQLNQKDISTYYESLDAIPFTDHLDKLIQDNKRQIQNIENNISLLEQKIKSNISENVLKNVKTNNKEYLEQSIIIINDNIERLNADILKYEEEFENLSNQIPKDINSVSEINDKIKLFQDKIIKNQKEIENHSNTYNKIKSEISKGQSISNYTKDLITSSRNKILETQKELETKFEQKKLSKELLEADISEENINNRIKLLKSQIDEYKTKKIKLIDKSIFLSEQLKGKQRTDIKMAREQISKIDNEYKKLNDLFIQLNAKIVNNEPIIANLKKNTKLIKEVENEYKIISEMSNLASGNNTQRLSFERYMLASYFEEIIACANICLDKMTDSRFQLSRKTEKGKGLAASGLDLQVFDNYTCSCRDTSTLSGGESFITSLSLAIGLSDIISRYQGGISIDTMFIDEGFGTLDSNSLDNVIFCLMKLQSCRRLIGIISHVQELKERILTKVIVSPSKTGSNLKIEM